MPPPRIPARMASRIRMIKFSTTGLFDWVLKPGISFLPDYVDARPFVLHGNSLDIMFPRGLERLYENPRCRAKDLQIMEFARYEIRRQGNANLPRRTPGMYLFHGIGTRARAAIKFRQPSEQAGHDKSQVVDPAVRARHGGNGEP